MFSRALTRSVLPARRPAPLLERISQARALWRSRRALSSLTDTQREDVGLSAQDAAKEAARPFWDAPPHWRR